MSETARPATGDKSGVGQHLMGTVIVNNYYWDQNKEFVKVYIEVDKNYALDSSQIQLTFKSNRSFSIVFGKYKFNLSKLLEDVDREGSHHKLTKSNKLIVYLKKTSDKEWPTIDEVVDKFKDQKEKGIPDMTSDPKGFMKLMKQMYDEGDDETKKAIAKSWYETQNMQGGMPDNVDVMNMEELQEMMK